MNARLLIRAAGPGVTIQDEGRFGHARFGVTPAGPMDLGAYLAATRAVGALDHAAFGWNRPNADNVIDSKSLERALREKPDSTFSQRALAAIEVSLGGVVLEAESATLPVAVAGGAFDIRLDGRALPSACVLPLAPGSRLSLRAGVSGAWCYVALGARLGVAPTLGSRAAHLRSGLGPKPLAAGDAFALADVASAPSELQALRAPWLAPSDAPIRVLLGPQNDYFAPEAVEIFLNAQWRIGARSDRMAYRLEGPAIPHLRGHDIVSDGVAMGAIQIPGDGAPLALMADRQPTGGYPKIATVIGADLGRLAQRRPGEALRFRAAPITPRSKQGRNWRRSPPISPPRRCLPKISSAASSTPRTKTESS